MIKKIENENENVFFSTTTANNRTARIGRITNLRVRGNGDTKRIKPQHNRINKTQIAYILLGV